MISLKKVAKSFGDAAAVEDLDLEIAAQETTVLIGPSGCGKSTLLRMMLGLLPPTSGQVCFQGEPVTPLTSASLRQRLGYVIQGGGLFPHLTAEGNVTLLARHLGRDADWIQARVVELANTARLDEALLQRYPLEMSGGQQQRVALMRALMLDPDVLLLDEPLGALDPIVRAELQEDLRHAFRSLGKTVVLVTHDLMEARYFADSIVLMQAGRMLQIGTYEDLVERPAAPFVTRFVSAQRPAFASGASA
ncbi:ATP-binding cassette domain-containing protein [Planctomycetes bacterium Poly30]|uniref:ATP-binding cassette domain-containing protein n=1 Tax=Saltatorellus ferox TaxID=2528018 RepID=UPI0011A7BDE7